MRLVEGWIVKKVLDHQIPMCFFFSTTIIRFELDDKRMAREWRHLVDKLLNQVLAVAASSHRRLRLESFLLHLVALPFRLSTVRSLSAVSIEFNHI